MTGTSGPAGLDIDPVNKVLYWTDLFRHTISSMTLDVRFSNFVYVRKMINDNIIQDVEKNY